MTDDGDSKSILQEAINLDLDIVIVLGVKEEKGSVILHNVDTDLDAAFLMKTFVATLDMSIVEELYGRTKRNLN
jgi:hypothetical protein